MTTHPSFGLVDAVSATLPVLEFKPGVHVKYQEPVPQVKGGRPELKDFPQKFGGSGEMAGE